MRTKLATAPLCGLVGFAASAFKRVRELDWLKGTNVVLIKERGLFSELNSKGESHSPLAALDAAGYS